MTHPPRPSEADLQAQLARQLERVFPLFAGRFVLERQLRLRLGHREITVDGLTPRDDLRGRCDMVAELDGRPLLVAELKAPDVSLRDADVQQALSYARAHVPPVPLVFVTNGAESAVYRAYDGARLDSASLDHAHLASTLAAAAALANAHVADAIRVLLGSSKETWTALAREWSADARRQLTGPVGQLSAPIAAGFVIPRQVCDDVEAHLRAGAAVVAVHGEPMAGVTHVLAQLSTAAAEEPRVLLAGPVHDVLQHMANLLARQLGVPVSKDDLRGWLNARRGLMSLTLLLDGLPTDLDELIELAEAGALRVVVGTDSSSLGSASVVSGRAQATRFGRLAATVHVGLLDDAEFAEAERIIAEQYGAGFLTGARHCLEFRRPRTLRAMLAALPAPSTDERVCAVLPSVYGAQHLAQAVRFVGAQPELFTDIGLLAKVYLEEVERRGASTDGAALAETWWAASVAVDAAEAALGAARVARLTEAGLLAPRWSTRLGARYVVRQDELLHYHVAQVWAARLSAIDAAADIVTALDGIVRTSSWIAGGDIAAACALAWARYGSEAKFGTAILTLLHRPPRHRQLGDGTVVHVMIRGGSEHHTLDGGAQLSGFVDTQAWLVLAHLSGLPLVFESADGPRALCWMLFDRLARHPAILRAPAPWPDAEPAGFHTHALPRLGEVLCTHTGLVEPVLYAMWIQAHHGPGAFVELAQRAAQERDFMLCWRVYAVSQALLDSTEHEVRWAAESAAALVVRALGPDFEALTARHAPNGARPNDSRGVDA